MTDDAMDRGSRAETPPRIPRWVWVSAIVVAVLAAVAVVAMVLSGVQHGPGQHTSMGAPASSAQG
jgi:hypothetical protein